MLCEGLEDRRYFAVSTDAAGWTVVTPSSDSRIVYVSTSGSDTNTGLSIDQPVATFSKARTLVRSGFPDEILLRRGDTFNGQSLGGWNLSGRSATEPFLIGAYTDPAAPTSARPKVNSGIGNGFSGANKGTSTPVSNVYILDVAFEAGTRNYREPTSSFSTAYRTDAAGGTYGVNVLGTFTGLWIEDCSFQYYRTNLAIQAGSGTVSNVTIRRNQILDAYVPNVDQFGITLGPSSEATSEGIYADGVNTLTIDGNVIDHNGWADNNALGAVASIYNHNLYLNTQNSNVSVVNNIISDASSHGLQMRAGGIVKNNLFVRNPIGMSFGYVNGSGKSGGVSGEISGNVFLEDRDIDGQTRGYSLELADLKPASAGGGTLVKNNIFASDSQKSFATIRVDMPSADATSIPNQTGIQDLTIDGNLIYAWYRGIYINSQYTMGGSGFYGLNNLVVKNNDIQHQFAGAIVDHGPAFTAGVETWTNNRYDSTLTETSSTKWFRVAGSQIAASTWKSTYEPTAILAAGLFPDPTRGVGGYNSTVGGTNSTDAFLLEERRQSKAFWRTSYTPDPVIDYVRAGFSGGRIDSAPPTASATTPNVTVAGGTTQTITAVYGDDNKINLSSINSGDLRVVGPNGYNAPVALVSSTGNSEGVARTVTYSFTPPSGVWSAAANGIYSLVLQPNELLDATGQAAPSATIGTFSVAIDPSVPSAVATAAAVVTDNSPANVTVTYTGAATPSLPVSVSPLNAGFETPNVGSNDIVAFQMSPVDGAWTYNSVSGVGNAGITGNNSIYTRFNTPAPQGAQVALLQGVASISQTIANWQAGTYVLTLLAAQRNENAASQDLQVLVDGQLVLGFTPTDATFQSYSAPSFTVSAGTHTIAIASLNTAGGDNTALIDSVQITGNTLPGQQSISAATLDAGDIQLVGPKSYAATPVSASVDIAADGTTRVVTYTFAAPAGGWSSVGNGSYAINSNAGQVLTTSSVAAPAGRIGTLSVAINVLAVTLQAGDVAAGSVNAQGFTLTFAGATPISVASLDSADLKVTGPAGFNSAVTFLGTNGGDGTASNPLVATYNVAPPTGGWTAAGNGTYYINAVAGQIVDVNNNPLPAAVVGTFKVSIDNTAPVAWTLAPDITSPTALNATPGSKTLGISLYDTSGINVASLDNADVRVVGPNGYDQPTTKTFVATSSTATYVTYALAPPAGGWKSSYNGTYSVVIQPNQIFDTAGNALSAAKTVDTFNVTLETTPPTVTLTAVSPAIRNTAVSSIAFKFSEVVLGASLSSLSLTLNGTAVSIAGATLATTDNINYTLSGISGLTAAAGNYVLSLGTSGITDLAGNALSAGASTNWTTDLTAPTAVATASNITLVNVGQSISVVYSDNVGLNSATFDSSDILVTGPGGYSQAAALSSFSGSGLTRTAIYTLANPAGGWKVANNGAFTIRLQSAQVADTAGNFAATAAIGGFTVSVETTPPTASASAPTITSVSTAPQSITVSYADNVAVDASTIDSSDLLVTGPNGYSSAATLVSVTGSGAGRTATYSIPAPTAGWRVATNGTYSIALNAGQIADTTGNLAVAGIIGSFAVAVETVPPTATATAATITSVSAAAQTITVNYADNVGVNASTIDNSDLTVSGPNGYSASATLVSLTPNGSGQTAVYTVPAPAGGWRVTGNGSYSINLVGSQIADTNGNPALAGTIGTFAVNIETTAPTASATAPTISSLSNAAQTITVAISDNVAVDASTIDSNDLTVIGPNGYTASATLVSVASNGAGQTAIYTVPSPTGGWRQAANGTYSIQLGAGQIADTAGNFATAGVIGTFAVSLSTTAPTVLISSVSPAYRLVPVDSVSIGFSTAVTGFDVTDLTLTRDGVAVPLDGVTLASTDGTTFTLGGLTTATTPVGQYKLSVAGTGSGITDTIGNALVTGSSISFSVATDSSPTAAANAPDLISISATQTITVVYGGASPIDSSTIDNNDVSVVAPDSTLLATTLSSFAADNGVVTAQYVLSAPTGSWQPSQNGVYAVILNPNQVSSTAGNFAVGTQIGSFNVAIDNTVPVATIAAVSPASRTTPVDSLTITFSKPVTGFDFSDLALTRDGSPISLAGASLGTNDNVTYTLAGLNPLNSAGGSYVMTLSAAGSGIVTASNMSLTSNATSAWTIVVVPTTPPPAITSISPTGVAGSPFLQNLTINGSDFTADDTVMLRNLTTGAVISNATIVSRSTTQLVVRSVFGTSAANWSAQVTGTTGTSSATNFGVLAQKPISVTATVDSTGKLATLNALNAVGVSLSFNWSTMTAPSGAPAVTFSSGGLAASTTATFGKAGTYTLKVRVSDGVTFVDTPVTVSVAQKLTTLVPTPTYMPLANSKSQQISVIASDQFANLMTTSPSVTWSMVSGPGTISSAGLYKSPATGSGTATFKATSGGISGSGSIVVYSAFFLWADFTTASASVDTGYQRDAGAVYAARGNGYTYGWNTSQTASAVDRNATVNQLVDTNIGIKTGGKWEVLVANGKYNVVVNVGDSGAASTNTVRVEGTSAFSALKLAANTFSSKTLTVTVSDGKLTIDGGSGANLATRLTYIRINKI